MPNRPCLSAWHELPRRVWGGIGEECAFLRTAHQRPSPFDCAGPPRRRAWRPAGGKFASPRLVRPVATERAVLQLGPVAVCFSINCRSFVSENLVSAVFLKTFSSAHFQTNWMVLWRGACTPSTSALPAGCGLASYVCMTDATRFQFRLPAAQRAQLEDLADQCGLSAAALTRLAICRLLEEPAGRVLFKPAVHHEHETGAAA